MRKIILELEGAKTVAVMHEKDMAKTCRAIWKLLPLRGKSIHANWAGREIMLHLEGESYVKLEQEGPKQRMPIVTHPAAGHISYFYREEGVLRGIQQAYSERFRRELCELAIYYGAAAPRMRDIGREPEGCAISNWFASFVMPIPLEFVRKCDDMRFSGLKTLTIRRAKGE